MQLAMEFENPVVNVVPSSQIGDEKLYSKWRALELLDELKGRTVSMCYQDEFSSFQIPVLIDEMSFYGSKTFPTVLKIGSISMDGSKYIDSIRLKDHRYTFTYCLNQKGQTEESKLSFRIKEYVISKNRSSHFEDEAGNLLFEKLRGMSVRVKVRCVDDIFYELTSIPFTITSIAVHDDALSIIGTNDTSLHFKGFNSIRNQGEYLLVDIFNEDHGYVRTFSIL